MTILADLKRFVEVSALDAHNLTPFGLYARWMFILGLYATAVGGNNKSGMDALKPLLDHAYTVVDPKILKHYRLRDEWLVNDVVKIAKNMDIINGWFNASIKNVPGIPMDEKDVFKRGIYLLKYSHVQEGGGTGQIIPTAIDGIEKMAKALSVKLGIAFANSFRFNKGTEKEFTGKKDIENLYTALEAVVKKLTGKVGTLIPGDKIKELKLKDGDEVRDLVQYTDLRKQISVLTKNSLYLILSNGNMQVEKVAKEMSRQGFRDYPFPTEKEGYTGFVGLDKQGKMVLYTTGGKEIVGNVAPNSKVKMNPKYAEDNDDQFYFLARAPGAVSDTRFYTTAYKDAANEEKHDKTANNTAKVAGWVKIWERDIFNKDPMRNVPATVALLLYLTSARVGTSKENQSLKGGAHTYGISTLRKQHVKVTSASILLSYVGKKGVNQKHTVKLDNKVNKRLGTILKGLLEGKKKDDLVFAFPRPLSRTGAIQEINPAFFRSYLKSTGVTINPHALRHIRGTALTVELINANPWKPSVKAKTLVAKQREAEAFIKEVIVKKVAQLLGHKATKNGVEVDAVMTSIKSYINPIVLVTWFKEHNLAVPRWIPTKLEDD